jgi:hypothetical protein
MTGMGALGHMRTGRGPSVHPAITTLLESAVGKQICRLPVQAEPADADANQEQ